jgi:putative ATP-dependent endonuclease of OLD family
MRLCKLLIENYRGIQHLELDLEDTTVLVGESNTGKTAILTALRTCLRNLGSRRRAIFDTYDFHLEDAYPLHRPRLATVR